MSAELASMMRCHFLLLSILVQVQCQETYPYVSFRNWTLANHSYVNLSTVGSDYYSVQCHTDLSTCCSDTEGIHRGDWYFPNGTRLPNFTSSTAIGESREAQKVVVNRNGGIKPSGIYCCDIAIDDGSTRDIIYVGMYFSNGGVKIPGAIIFTEISDLNGLTPQFILTCISTGGPATTVTWTRDSTTVTEGTQTVLDDPETAQYTHTLTGRLLGLYRCTVSNNKPSSVSRGVRVDDVLIRLNENIIPNHGYVELRDISLASALDCLKYNRQHEGSWISPDGTTVDSSGSVPGFRTTRSPLIVRLLRTSGAPQQGIYQCVVQNGIKILRTLYVGLYNSGEGRIQVLEGMNFTLDSDSQFTLTCISTGGPATTVTWTRDSTVVTEGTQTVLDDPVTARYIHTLTVTERREGIYTCTVANDVSSESSTEFDVEAPYSPHLLKVSQNGPNSLIVSWMQPYSRYTVTGYHISYQRQTYYHGEHRGTVMTGGGNRTANITGLIAGGTYSISIVAKCSILPSYPTTATFTLLTISLTSSPTYIVAGGNVTLRCSISSRHGIYYGSPDFQWEGPGLSDSIIIKERLYSQVLLNEILTSQAGFYNCSFSNDQGYTATYIVVTIHIKTPTPYVWLSNAPLVAGSELSLSCNYTLSSSVDSVIAELVIWTMNGSVVAPDQRISTDGPTLTFSPLTTFDSGSYVCTLVIAAPHITVGSPAESQEEIIVVLLPQTSVVVSYNQSGPLLAGTAVTLTCTLSANSGVDHEAVSTHWSGLDHIPPKRYSDTAAMRVSDGSYTGTLTISPLAEGDDGTLSCTGTVTGRTGFKSVTDSTIINVLSLPAPSVNISFSGYSIAGQNYSLNCTATVVPGLVVDPDMKIVFPNSTVVSVTDTTSVEHTFSPLRVSDSGQYTCTATINIPQAGITDLLSTTAKTVSVVYAYPVERLWSETIVAFYWIGPRTGAHLALEYNLTCQQIEVSTNQTTIVPASQSSVVLTDLHPGTRYNCSIVTIGALGNSEPVSAIILTPEAAPSGVPEMFEVEVREREVVFSWSPPPLTQQNGVITSYTLSCSPSPSSLPVSPSHSGSLTVAGFSPNTFYSCSLVASNSQGSGPPDTLSFTTKEDYAYFQLWLKGSLECSEVISQLSEQEHKKNITSTVLAQLSPTCAECSNETIDNQSLSCYKESPSYLTYRARLEGTSERGSDSLVSMIEDWVGGGASIIVTGVLMTVDSHCSVVISSLSEGECSPVFSSPFESISKPVLTPTKSPTTKDTTPNDSSQSSTDNTGVIIIGGVFAIVVVAITIIAIAALILKNSRATEKHLVPASAIPTSSNSAYGMVHKKAGRLNRPQPVENEGAYEVPLRSLPPPPPDQPLPPLPPLLESEETEQVYETIPG